MLVPLMLLWLGFPSLVVRRILLLNGTTNDACRAHRYPTGRKQKGEPNSVPAFLKMLDPKLTKQFALAHQVRLGCM